MGSSFGCGWGDEGMSQDAAGPCPKCKKHQTHNGHVSISFHRNGKTTSILCKGCGFKVAGCVNDRAAIRAWNEEKPHG